MPEKPTAAVLEVPTSSLQIRTDAQLEPGTNFRGAVLACGVTTAPITPTAGLHRALALLRRRRGFDARLLLQAKSALLRAHCAQSGLTNFIEAGHLVVHFLTSSCGPRHRVSGRRGSMGRRRRRR